MNATVIQPVRFAKNDVRNVKFVATKSRVRVTCKGKPVIRVTIGEQGYAAVVADQIFTGKTPAAAYKAAVRAAWSN